MVRIFIFLCLLFSANSSFAQKTITVTGLVRGDDGKVMPKANVTLVNLGTKDTLKTITNKDGKYTFDEVKTSKVLLTITYVGYKKFSDEYDYTTADGEQNNFDIVLTAGNFLETVTIQSSKVYIKEDTVGYRIDSTMYRKNDNVEEVLKRLPGVEVDKDGKVKAQGVEVTKVRVNGKDFFGGDVATATRQLNADMVDRIQIIDDYGDQAAFTGVKSGDPTKTMNIQLKKEKNKGIFGNVTLGGGTEQRYSNALNFNVFNNNQQISFNGNLNNINANTFDFSRLPGGMGSMAGGAVRAFGGGGNNSNGIGVSKSFGLNYRDQWSKKVSVNGSYSFSTKDNNVINDIFQEFPNARTIDSSIFNKQISTTNNITDNHRFDFNVDYNIDSFNYVRFSPGITFRKVYDEFHSSANSFYGNGQNLNFTNNNDINNSTTPNYNGSLLFNHRFHKKGRSLSINLNGANNFTNGTDVINNTADYYKLGNYLFTGKVLQDVIQDNNNYNYGVTASFNEKLTKTKGLEFNYSYNKRFVENDKETYNTAVFPNVLVPAQTNIFNNIYTTNRIGANYRVTLKKYNYAIGLAVQPATIESNTFTGTKLVYKQNIVNYFPMLRIAYNFSKSKSLNVNYDGRTNQPSFQQSQPVPDVSNPQNIVIGNPNLRPEFSNTFSSRYNNFNIISGNALFSNISFTFTKDKIVNNVVNKLYGAREVSYLNSDGFFNLNGFYVYSKPIKNRKYVFNVGGSIFYNSYTSFLDNVKNKGKNWIISQRFSMDYKLKNWLETSGGAVFTFNETKNSLASSPTNSIKGWSLTHSTRLFFKHDFNFSYDISQALNYGYTSNVLANPLIVNATLEKMFLKSKNASFKLQAFDLLNENTNLNRTVSQINASITDTRTNRVQRFFLLSFVYRFNKFSGSNKMGPGMAPPPPPGMGGGMRMGF